MRNFDEVMQETIKKRWKQHTALVDAVCELYKDCPMCKVYHCGDVIPEGKSPCPIDGKEACHEYCKIMNKLKCESYDLINFLLKTAQKHGFALT